MAGTCSLMTIVATPATAIVWFTVPSTTTARPAILRSVMVVTPVTDGTELLQLAVDSDLINVAETKLGMANGANGPRLSSGVAIWASAWTIEPEPSRLAKSRSEEDTSEIQS